MDVYGHTLDEFLALEPDEIAALIFPEVRAEASRHEGNEINSWNFRLSASTRYGAEIAESVSEGIEWLVSNGYLAHGIRSSDPNTYVLSRRGRAFAPVVQVAEMKAMGLLRAAALHRDLATTVLPIFRRAQYDLAVLAALRVVEHHVQTACGRNAKTVSETGVPLMRKAFGGGGPLADANLDAGERHARADLFAGAMGVYRNPGGHAPVRYDDPQEAAEVVLFANNLLRHLGRAHHATRGRGRPRRPRSRTP